MWLCSGLATHLQISCCDGHLRCSLVMPQSLQRHLGHMSNVAKLTLTQGLTAQVPKAPAVLLGTDGRRRKKITRRVGYARDADDDGLPGKQ